MMFLIGTITGAIATLVIFGLCYMVSQPIDEDEEISKNPRNKNTKE